MNIAIVAQNGQVKGPSEKLVPILAVQCVACGWHEWGVPTIVAQMAYLHCQIEHKSVEVTA